MITSEQIKELAESMVKAQAEFPAITKSKTAKTPKFSYDYADYAAILDLIRPVLNRHGIAIIQGVEATGKTVKVTTRLLHVGGGWMESSLCMEAESAEPQKLGSAISYARRYGFLSMVGAMPQEEDDDGAKAAEPSKEPPKAPFPQESSERAGRAMKAAVRPAPERKAGALEYLWARYGKEDGNVRVTLARILGRTFPDAEEIRISLAELEKLETVIRSGEIKDELKEV